MSAEAWDDTRRRERRERRAAAALRLAVAVLAAGACISAPVANADAPVNDNYLAAVALNAPGSAMPRDTVTSPATNTAGATLQSDLFKPSRSGGPPEPSRCGPTQTPLGKTVWYRFFPDVDGTISVQAVGFDSTVAVIPFASASDPLPQGYTCSNKRDDTIETLKLPVEKGASYAVQVGGSATSGLPAFGTLQVSFTYLPDRDGDGVADDDDQCPTRPGTVNGCPPRIIARLPYKFDAASNGLTLRSLAVRGVPRGSRIDVRCSRGCRHRRLAFHSPVTRLPGLAGRFFASGSSIVVRVVKSGYVGDYTKLGVLSGDIKVTHRCTQPGSSIPRRSCR